MIDYNNSDVDDLDNQCVHADHLLEDWPSDHYGDGYDLDHRDTSDVIGLNGNCDVDGLDYQCNGEKLIIVVIFNQNLYCHWHRGDHQKPHDYKNLISNDSCDDGHGNQLTSQQSAESHWQTFGAVPVKHEQYLFVRIKHKNDYLHLLTNTIFFSAVTSIKYISCSTCTHV